MQSIIVKDRQSLIDIAIQYAGAPEAVFDFCLLNNVSPSEDLETGAGIIMIGEVMNGKIAFEFEKENMIPATKDSLQMLPGGIGYMQIGTDFKVR